MANTKTNKTVRPHESVHPAMGGVIGAVIGAVVGSSLAIALQNEKTRKAAINKFDEIKDVVIDTFNEIREDKQLQQRVQSHLNEGKKNVTKNLDN